MKKKVSITIDEDIHIKMKEIALKRKMNVSDLYEEIARDSILKLSNQTTLDDK